MSCFLRALGKDFDAEKFVTQTSLPVDDSWRKGDLRFPKSKWNKETLPVSGVKIVVSDANFSELNKQIKESINFLRTHFDAIKVLTSIPEVEEATINFGAEIKDPFWANYFFPPQLLQLAGDLKLHLEVSVYPTQTEESEDIGAIQASMARYFDGLYHSDVAQLAQVFHPKAIYACATDGTLLYKTMPEYFEIVRNREAPSARGEKRQDMIVSIDIAGENTAVVKAHCAIGPKYFTDFLTFVRVDDRWQIISKVFHYELRG